MYNLLRLKMNVNQLVIADTNWNHSSVSQSSNFYLLHTEIPTTEADRNLGLAEDRNKNVTKTNQLEGSQHLDI